MGQSFGFDSLEKHQKLPNVGAYPLSRALTRYRGRLPAIAGAYPLSRALTRYRGRLPVTVRFSGWAVHSVNDPS
jgi:hypothetical protein